MSETPTPAIPFPPQEIGDFLRFCAGEWISLNSVFELDNPAGLDASSAEGEGNEWHSSERGELVVTYIEPQTAGEPGGLSQGPKGGSSHRWQFQSNGRYSCANGEGQWQLWPDGSLELILETDGLQVRERLWFTKPNLRLRSSVANQNDGMPKRAHFSSEIRRVSAA